MTIFSQYVRMSRSIQQNYKHKHLNNTQKDRLLKVKNSLIELKKYFKPINVSIDDMDKFEEKEIQKRTIAKNPCYKWYD